MSIDPKIQLTARQKLGEYLKGIREHRGMSLRDVATKAGVEHTQVISVEKGRTAYTIDTFLAITSALDCYFFLSDRGGEHLNAEHMVNKSKDPI